MSDDSQGRYGNGIWTQGLGWAIALTIGASCIQLLLPVHPAVADEGESEESINFRDRPGLCALRNETSGRWVHDGNGQMVPLREICGDSDAWDAYVSSFDEELAAIADNPIAEPLTPEQVTPNQEFWLRFRTAASNEALEFARSLELSAVIDYGQTICPLLNDGVTMDEVRDTQVEADLPADFDAAVNVAAIHTYCPQHVTQIGR